MKPTVIDLFAGCGGFSQGFMQAGCDVIGFVEWWKPTITTFSKNHPKIRQIGTDITKVPTEDLVQYKGKVDIIVGGPPCQGFSFCGKRDPKDQRNQLYQEFLRFVKVIEPKIVVIENVPGLLSMKDYDNEKIIDKIVHELIGLGYFVGYKVLTASDYGVPQSRQRLFIIAKKLGLFPSPSKKKRTVMDAIADLPDKENGLNGHVFFDTTKEIIEKINSLQQGERLSKKYNFSRQRLYSDKPAKTVVTKPIFIHPFHNRFLTPRELARLQSFPDDFFFCGFKTDMVKQIGNAVPPVLARTIAKKIMEVGL